MVSGGCVRAWCQHRVSGHVSGIAALHHHKKVTCPDTCPESQCPVRRGLPPQFPARRFPPAHRTPVTMASIPLTLSSAQEAAELTPNWLERSYGLARAADENEGGDHVTLRAPRTALGGTKPQGETSVDTSRRLTPSLPHRLPARRQRRPAPSARSPNKDN